MVCCLDNKNIIFLIHVESTLLGLFLDSNNQKMHHNLIKMCYQRSISNGGLEIDDLTVSHNSFITKRFKAHFSFKLVMINYQGHYLELQNDTTFTAPFAQSRIVSINDTQNKHDYLEHKVEVYTTW